MEEKRERPYVTGGGRMGNSSSFPRPSYCPYPPPHNHRHMHTLPYLMPASIPTVTQQNTTMQLTLYASPAILGVAATSPKMAPSERAQRYSNDPTGPLSAHWHERRIPRWQHRWHEKLLGTKKKRRGGGGREEEEVAIPDRPTPLVVFVLIIALPSLQESSILYC